MDGPIGAHEYTQLTVPIGLCDWADGPASWNKSLKVSAERLGCGSGIRASCCRLPEKRSPMQGLEVVSTLLAGGESLVTHQHVDLSLWNAGSRNEYQGPLLVG